MARSRISIFSVFSLLYLFSVLAQAETIATSSPDGKIEIAVTVAGSVSYTVTFNNQLLIKPSQLGLVLDNQNIGDTSQVLIDQEKRSGRDRFTPVVGKTNVVDSPYNEVRLKLKNSDNPALPWQVVFRAYDDGIAFRYHLPPSNQLNEFTIQQERTQFRFAGDYSCYGLNLGRFVNPHEGEFDPIRASKIRPSHLYDAPFVCKTGYKETTIALAEANLVNYSGAYYTGLGDGDLGLQVQLTPRFDEDKSGLNNMAVKAKMSKQGFSTPWRVVMVGASPSTLIESNLINALAEPSAIGDTSWIKPGKVAWDWWNDNRVAIKNPGMNTATYKAYIDFAATLGLEYILIDAGWYKGSSLQSVKGANVVQTVPDMDMEEIVAYAAKHEIGVWLWLQWKQLDWQMDEALKAYQNWGIKGIKVDFMDRHDQEMVDYYHKLLSKSAQNKLMVDLHGAFPPKGLVRTYPNYLTQEGVMGAEYNKWSVRVTATHNVTLPFTRMLLGPMDYTPGGFRHLSPEQFKTQFRNTLPFVQTTRGQALAMYVVYESPLQMLSDSPLTYSKTDGVWPQPNEEWQPGLEFLAEVPVTWDETRALQGNIGEYVVIARRNGDTWYLGAMTNEQGRKLKVPLNFLPKGRYQITTWQDGKEMSDLERKTIKRSSKDTLNLVLKPSGGAAAVIKPLP